MGHQSEAVGRFRPVSAADFSAYAKHLAWVIQEPLRQTQELLARIYGYSGTHELQQVLKVPGEPGPFDCDWLFRDEHDRLRANPAINTSQRSNRVLDLVCAAKGIELKDLDHRGWLSRDLDLFNPPQQHRDTYRQMRLRLEVIDGTGQGGFDLLPQAYAEIDESFEGERLLRFTVLGEAMYEAVRDLMEERPNNPLGKDIIALHDRMQEIATRHPSNPWPQAMWLAECSQRVLPQEWSADDELDPHPEKRTEWERNALALLPEAKRVIRLFETLYGSLRGVKVAHCKLASPHSDCYTYPALLFAGGIIALHCGEYALARRWLLRNQRFAYQDNFGVRFFIDAVREKAKAMTEA